MKTITINITDNNYNFLKRQYEEYNVFNDTKLSMDQFKEIVFIDGLLSHRNCVDVRSKRSGYGFATTNMSGDIIEYR